ncbi:MAG TPA: channel protein TolC [Comamonadaceae bacterium]|uniref:TolC family outer membrane protein n=1 Tax=Pulveribacter sp. TaxID=2678893 RepID=UPI000EEDEF89|nr:TolC family outer membrane protein [Pulveribacter sp.]HCL86674.1 channel protein TolC [Comamonadaceae bacterium]
MPLLHALRRTGAIAALGWLLALPAGAMDLLGAYQTALQQDAATRAARAAALAGQERVEQARAQLYPSLSLSAGYLRNDLSRSQGSGPQRSSSNESYPSHNATLTARQPLYRKALSVGLEQARRQREEADAALERETQDLGVRVAEAYMQILLAGDQLALIEAQKRATATQLDAAGKLLAAGSGTRTDIDEAQARLDMALARELEARQQQDYAVRQLALLVNAPVDAAALRPLDAARLGAWQPAQRDLQQWLALAEDRSPELRQLRARLDAARLEVEKARSGHLPTLDAVAQWSRSASENVTTPSTRYTNRSIGVQLNVPLYAGGYVSATVRQALAEEERARELLEAARRDLALRIHTELRNVSEGPMRLHALEQAARSAAQLALSNRKSFEGGARTMVDVLNAEQQKAQALLDLARARYVYLVSSVRLPSLAGAPAEAEIAAINGLLGLR